MTTLIAWAFAALLVTLFIWCLSRMSPPTKDIEGKILAYGGTMRPMPRKAHEKLYKGHHSFDPQLELRREFEKRQSKGIYIGINKEHKF